MTSENWKFGLLVSFKEIRKIYNSFDLAKTRCKFNVSSIISIRNNDGEEMTDIVKRFYHFFQNT